jgi:hypothetical protein
MPPHPQKARTPEITNVPSARQAAGDQHVTVMGGASIGQQKIAAGLFDETPVRRQRSTLVTAM